MKAEAYRIRIGPKLRKVLDMQKKIVQEFTYETVKPSYYEVGEIIADKILKNNLV